MMMMKWWWWNDNDDEDNDDDEVLCRWEMRDLHQFRSFLVKHWGRCSHSPCNQPAADYDDDDDLVDDDDDADDEMI